jgi:hypothetical protein
MKRHQKQSLRQPQLTSLARVLGFNGVAVHMIFYVLANIVDKHKIAVSRTSNMDETSHTVVQCPEKIIPQKGKHQAGAILWCD